ncbi:MAG: peptidoglycan DD-metalloendopeptidase family protein, partial [Betaproteobacteria bacterium]
KPGEPVTSPLIITSVPSASTSPGNTDKMKTEPKAGKVPYSDAAYAKLSAEAASSTSSSAPLVATPVTITPAIPPVGSPPAVIAAPATTAPVASSAGTDVDWAWPIQPAPPKSRILSMFTEASKGIDISGAKNSPVLAAAPGKIVYSGAGLRGYGRLVIIKHNETWLSAYAHNEKILVMEGQDVRKGQPIAEMGSSDTDVVKLHFEIRRQGKPVDPMKFLPN